MATRMPATVNREFEKGFAAAIEHYQAGQPQAAPAELNRNFGPRYANGYSYGWLEAQCKRMSVAHFRQPYAAPLGQHRRADGLVTQTD